MAQVLVDMNLSSSPSIPTKQSGLCMGQYNEFVEIFKKDLEREQEKLRLYQKGELRSMALEGDRWCDSTATDIKQTKDRIAELKARIAKF